MNDKDMWRREVQLAHRQLRMCKWHQFLKKVEIRAYIDIVRKMYKI